MEINPSHYYTYKQAQDLFSVGPRGLMQHINSGALVPNKINRKYFFSGEELIRFIKTNTVVPKQAIVPII